MCHCVRCTIMVYMCLGTFGQCNPLSLLVLLHSPTGSSDSVVLTVEISRHGENLGITLNGKNTQLNRQCKALPVYLLGLHSDQSRLSIVRNGIHTVRSVPYCAKGHLIVMFSPDCLLHIHCSDRGHPGCE